MCQPDNLLVLIFSKQRGSFFYLSMIVFWETLIRVISNLIKDG